MIRNYIKLAWRNLIQNKGYSIINITGFSVGLAVSILIAVYVFNEKSYDTYGFFGFSFQCCYCTGLGR